MDWKSLPPLGALRAFAAYADTRSVQGASEVLNVTAAAISQQIRALESHVGLSLVDRRERRLRLTDQGERLAQALLQGLGGIAETVDELTRTERGRPLHISTTPSFAAFWLMPRLAQFRAHNPDVDLLINPSPALVPLSAGGVDALIRFGAGDWPGMQVQRLITSPLVIVAAPALVAGRDISRPEDLQELPWVVELGHDEATQWLRDHGVTAQRRASVLEVPGNLKLEGARAGQGVMAISAVFVQDDLRAGRLVQLFADQDDKGYHLCTAPGTPRPALRAFVRWVVAEARKT